MDKETNYIKDVKKSFKLGRDLLKIATLLDIIFSFITIKGLLNYNSNSVVDNTIYIVALILLIYNLFKIRKRYKENIEDEKRIIASDLEYKLFINNMKKN